MMKKTPLSLFFFHTTGYRVNALGIVPYLLPFQGENAGNALSSLSGVFIPHIIPHIDRKIITDDVG
jgi:hypothetical protein